MKTIGVVPGFAVALSALAGCGLQVDDARLEELGLAKQALEGFSIKQPILGGGTGCPSSTSLGSEVAPDGSSFSIFFQDMKLHHAPGGSPNIQAVNCVVGLVLTIPDNMRFRVPTITTDGYASLAPKTKATDYTTYRFSGDTNSFTAKNDIPAPYDDTYHFGDPVSPPLVSPCGGSAILNINSQLSLNTTQSSGKESYIDAQLGTGAFMSKDLYCMWEEC